MANLPVVGAPHVAHPVWLRAFAPEGHWTVATGEARAKPVDPVRMVSPRRGRRKPAGGGSSSAPSGADRTFSSFHGLRWRFTRGYNPSPRWGWDSRQYPL